MTPTARAWIAGLLVFVVTSGSPAWAIDWTVATTNTSHTRSHCYDPNPSCWVTYTGTTTSYTGYFSSQEEAAAACSAVLDGRPCGYASGEPGPPLMSGGWLSTCPGGVNQYGLCVSSLHRYAVAYFPTLVVEQDIERPVDCKSTQRRFGNPIDALTGEKHEQLALLRWSSDAPPLRLHYRSGRFVRQVGVNTLAGNNIPGRPPADGAVGLGIPDGAGHQPLGHLWTHSLDARVTLLPNGVRISRIDGSGGLTFRGRTDGSAMLPPADQGDRLYFLGGAGGAYWLHRDPRRMRTNYFSASGMLIHTVQADGTGRQWLHYSDSSTPRSVAAGPDRLLAVQDASGRQLRIGYQRDAANNATDRITSVTDDSGAQTGLSYDTFGRLSAVRWPDGPAVRYIYSPTLPWALTNRLDEVVSRVGNWTWNASTGLATSSTGADGVERHVLQHAQPPHVVVTDTLEGPILRRKYSWQPGSGAQVTKPNGSTVTLLGALRQGDFGLTQRTQPAGSGCDASISTSVLDANGNAVVKDDFAGGRSCHAYDTARNLELVRVEGLDRSANCAALLTDSAPLPPGARKITTRWHPVWPLAEVVASPGQIEHRVYNGRPDPSAPGATASCMPWLGGGGVPVDSHQPAALCRRTQTATVDANGARGLTAALDAATPPRAERWTYSRHGQPLSHDGPRTDVADITTWSYHAADTADARAGDLAEVRNGIGHATRFHRWDARGLLLSYSDANHVRTDLTYDRRQHVIGINEAAGSPWARQTVQQWDARGLLRRTELPTVAATNAAGAGGDLQPRSLRRTYDRAHRLVGVLSDTGHGTSFKLDTSGNVVARSLHHGDDVNRPPTVQTWEFDALDRPWRAWSTIHGVARATELQHDAMGRLTSIQRPMAPLNGDTQPPREQRRYDSLGHMVQSDLSASGLLAATTLTHDASGNLSTLLSPGGARFEFDVDSRGQVRREVGPDSGLVTQRHDAAGNLVSQTDARGVMTTHGYDALNRRIWTERRASGAGAGTGTGVDLVRYTWDANPGGPTACSHGMGRLCRIDDSTGTRHFSYDPFGHLAEQWTVELGQTQRQTFAWSADGRLIASADAGGASTWSRDANGHVVAVGASVNGQPARLVSLGGLRADGDADARSFGNGIQVRRLRDSSGALLSQTSNPTGLPPKLCPPGTPCPANLRHVP